MREKAIGWDQLRGCAVTRMTLATVIDDRPLRILSDGMKVMR